MANNYSQHAMHDTLQCSKEDFENLHTLLENCEDAGHGFTIEFYPDGDEATENGQLYIFAEDIGNEDALSDEFLDALSKIIKKNNLSYIVLGVAHTCSKMRPGDFGGGDYRITAKGGFSYPQIIWPEV